MKKLILTLLVTSASLAAFAQGKISFANDSNHLLYFNNYMKAPDIGLANQPISSSPTPSGATFLVDLYGGATAGSMTLQRTTTISATPGYISTVNFTSLNLPGGVVATFQVQVRESTFATAELAQLGGGYWGFSPIFTMTPSSTIAFNSIVNAGGTALSTWGAGNILVPGLLIPEPSSLALTGLGISALLFRRKR